MARPDERAGDGGPVTPTGMSRLSESLEKSELPYVTIDALGEGKTDAEKTAAGDTAGAESSEDAKTPPRGLSLRSARKKKSQDNAEEASTSSTQTTDSDAGDDESAAAKKKPRSARFPWKLRGWGRRKLRAIAEKWRRSLQFRTVLTTTGLAVIILMVTLFGLSAQIAQRLLDNKVAGAERDLNTARVVVEAQLNASDRAATDETRMASTLAALTSQAPGAGQLSANAGSFVPVLYIPGDGLRPAISTPDNLQIPLSLVNFVSSNQVSYQYSDMDLGAGRTKVLIVGTPTSVDMPDLQLYLIYSLASEERTLNLFNTTLFSGGLLIVALMAFASYLVSQQLVRPIRAAANTAQRFASGDLDSRMDIRGEDDFAVLAESFNEMAESLKQQIVQLEEFGSAQKRFTSDVSHELRTPLTTVRMAADIIYDHADNLDPGTARASQLMVKELDKFETLLNDLLEISRHDAGVAELNAEQVDIRTCVYSALASVSGVAASVDVSTEVDMPDEPVVCEVDSRRVERILRNLLANAYDHSEGEPISLTVRADDNAVGVSVRDHGVGLKPGEAKKVFDRFWRADPSRVRQSGGTGLGLAIATQDAELHGGRLEAWGYPGEGSCFRFTLPRRLGTTITSSPVPLHFPIENPLPADTGEGLSGEIPISATLTGEIPFIPHQISTDQDDAPMAADAAAYSDTPLEDDGVADGDDPSSAEAAPKKTTATKTPLEGLAKVPETTYVSADIDTGEQHVVDSSPVFDHPDIIIEEDDL